MTENRGTDFLAMIARKINLSALALFGLCVGVTYNAYQPTFHFGFVFDDFPTIVHNFYLKVQTYQEVMFAHSRWVSTIWNSFTYQKWGMTPYYFRIFNFGLHVTNAFLVFVLFQNLFTGIKKDTFVQKRATTIALLAAALFMIHPVQTQTATYITQMRLEGLATLCVLLVMACSVLGAKAQGLAMKSFFYGLAAFLAAMSAGTKEIVVVIPLLLVLVDLFFLAQGDIRDGLRRLPWYAGISLALYIAFHRFSFSSTVPFSMMSVFKLNAEIDCNRGNLLTSHPKEKITALKYLISEFQVMFHYMWMYIWPTNLSFDYDWTMLAGFWQLEVLFPLAMLLASLFTSLFLWIKNKSHLVSFGVVWFFIAVYPRASIVPSAEMACDYKTYLGSVGMMVLLAYVLVWLASWIVSVLDFFDVSVKDRWMQCATAFCVIFACHGATIKRNDVWSTPLKFWTDVTTKAPKTSRGFNNLAVALAELGRTEEALEHYKKSIERDQYYAEPLINLGSHYQVKGDDDAALEWYGKALNLTHEPHPECYNNVGLIQYNHKNYDKAASCFKTAILLKAFYGKAHYNLARVHYDQGCKEEALKSAADALYSDFTLPHVHLLHGKCAVELGKYREGIKSLETALRSGQDFDGMFLLGTAHYSERNYARAVKVFERCYHQRPDNLICAYNLGQALMNNGQYVEAIPLFEQSAKDLEHFPFAPLHLSKCLDSNGNRMAALDRIDKVCASDMPAFVKSDAMSLRNEIIARTRLG